MGGGAGNLALYVNWHSPKQMKNLEGTGWQSGRTLSSPPVISTPKSQLTAEQPSVKTITQSWPTLCDPMGSNLHQAPPSMGFSRQEYWSGLPFPSPGDLPDPGIEPRSPAL